MSLLGNHIAKRVSADDGAANLCTLVDKGYREPSIHSAIPIASRAK